MCSSTDARASADAAEDPRPRAIPRAAPDHLRECPERDALAVGEAAALVPPDVVDQPVDVFVQLPDQPGLPDAADPLHGDQMDLPVVRGIVEELLDQSKLRSRPVKGGSIAVDRPAPAETDDPHGSPEIDAACLAFQLERAGRLVGDHGVGRPHRGFADEDGAGLGDRLDARGGVHEVAGDHALVLGSSSRRPRRSEPRPARADPARRHRRPGP